MSMILNVKKNEKESVLICLFYELIMKYASKQLSGLRKNLYQLKCCLNYTVDPITAMPMAIV